MCRGSIRLAVTELGGMPRVRSPAVLTAPAKATRDNQDCFRMEATSGTEQRHWNNPKSYNTPNLLPAI